MRNNNLADKYRELLALTQLYLLQEYSFDERIFADKDSYEYFKNIALQQKSLKPSIVPSQPQPQQLQKTVQTVRPTLPPAPNLHKPLPMPSEPPKPMPVIEALPAPKAEPLPIGPFELQPLQAKANPTPADFKNLIQKHAPGLTVNDQIPDDTQAKSINQKLSHAVAKPSILILYANSSGSFLPFINNMAKGISSTLALAEALQAEEIENNDQWDALLNSPQLRLIISASLNLKNFPKLMRNYRESASQPFLGNVPLVKILDLASCLNDQKQKALLWNSIKSSIKQQ